MIINDTSEALPQGTTIYFTVSGIAGTHIGIICGIANTGIPVIGRGYIVGVIDKDYWVDLDGVPIDMEYSHLVIFENQIEVYHIP